MLPVVITKGITRGCMVRDKYFFNILLRVINSLFFTLFYFKIIFILLSLLNTCNLKLINL